MSTDQDREHYGLARYDIGSRALDWVEAPDRDVVPPWRRFPWSAQ
ncbi:MAG TPA: hypothetical protein VFQ21_03935 [Gemmatimonadota bacterium]|nr:hypothetical protein [Gemmatimonadota bacterium]